MQLKLKRSQRSGLLGKVIFALDARVDYSAAEQTLVQKHSLGKLVIYDSEARKKNAAAADNALAQASSTSSLATGLWKNASGIARIAMTALSLRITADGLASGQHIECKDLNELLGAEGAIRDACESLRAYIDTAVTFDGREEVIEF